ncbi:hypothetical protein [Nostoc sp.]|uniref:hypothetical protein n=1 Tax=Nostoc sp. TaxID=1180 RepID=UPI002FFD424B
MNYLVISLNLSIKETVNESKKTKIINISTVADEIIVIFLTQIERLIMFSKLFCNKVLASSLALPNFKQTTSIAILVAGIGLFGIKSADASNALVQTPDVSQSSSYMIAQLVDANSPIYGSWQLKYSVDGVVHTSVLVMNGYSGVMRTRYFSSKKRQVVDQKIRLKSSPRGLVFLGYNPVYAGTSTRHPTYAADNFLFAIEDDGSFTAFTCDDRRQCSPVDVEEMISQS